MSRFPRSPANAHEPNNPNTEPATPAAADYAGSVYAGSGHSWQFHVERRNSEWPAPLVGPTGFVSSTSPAQRVSRGTRGGAAGGMDEPTGSEVCGMNPVGLCGSAFA